MSPDDKITGSILVNGAQSYQAMEGSNGLMFVAADAGESSQAPAGAKVCIEVEYGGSEAMENWSYDLSSGYEDSLQPIEEETVYFGARGKVTFIMPEQGVRAIITLVMKKAESPDQNTQSEGSMQGVTMGAPMLGAAEGEAFDAGADSQDSSAGGALESPVQGMEGIPAAEQRQDLLGEEIPDENIIEEEIPEEEIIEEEILEEEILEEEIPEEEILEEEMAGGEVSTVEYESEAQSAGGLPEENREPGEDPEVALPEAVLPEKQDIDFE